MPDRRHEFDSRQGREQFEPFDPERPRAPRAAVRWILGWDLGIAVFIVGGVWLLYLGNALVAFDEEQLRDTLERRKIFFWIATLFTVVTCLVTPVRISGRLRLAARGKTILGNIKSATYYPGIGGGLSKISITYKVRGYIYRKTISTARHLSRGDQLLLVIDPRRPKRCAMYDDIFPPVADTADERYAPEATATHDISYAVKAKEDVLEQYMPSKWWWARLALGIGILVMGIGMMIDPVGWEPRPRIGGRGDIFRVISELVGMRVIGGVCIALGLFLGWVGYDDLGRWLRRRRSR